MFNAAALLVLLATAPSDPLASTGPRAPDPDVVPKAFVILKATPSYDDARAAAAAAAETLAIRMDLRGLIPDGTIGLTLPEADCADEFGEFPCYVPRGRWDDGVYLSVEHSSSFAGFDENQYLVVLASGAPHDHGVRAALRRAKSAYPTAYVKTVPVYLGCLH
jgi:hypothetical protein